MSTREPSGYGAGATGREQFLSRAKSLWENSAEDAGAYRRLSRLLGVLVVLCLVLAAFVWWQILRGP